MTVYLTTFDPDTREPTAESIDSGFASLEAAVEAMGSPQIRTPAMLIYDGGILISKIPFYLGESSVRN